MNILPLALAGGAILLLGSKKKRAAVSTAAEDEAHVEEEVPQEMADEGEGDEGAVGPEYGDIVAKGLRKDRLGSHAWQILFEEDGYHSRLMKGISRFDKVKEELGVAASMRAAKELIRDDLNDKILAAGYQENHLLEDPVPPLLTTIKLLS